ncbi:MAG: methyltransferase domain-containing protein [Myxococcota bacterium]
MFPKHILELMQCPACGNPELGIGNRRQPDLVCEACGERYPFEDGIPDLIPRSTVQQYRYYRTDTLLNLIAPIYNYTAPIMSLIGWQCPPLRYVDKAHKAVGRSRGGVYLECPIGTGLLLGHIRPQEHVDSPFIGVDSSWGMLRQARLRFSALGLSDRVFLMRCDPEHLPFKEGTIRSLQSTNGLHTFNDRTRVLREFDRLLEPGGYVSGSTLVRGQGVMADSILGMYERYGVFPMLRSREFVIRELKQTLRYATIHHETHGSILFFSGIRPGGAFNR